MKVMFGFELITQDEEFIFLILNKNVINIIQVTDWPSIIMKLFYTNTYFIKVGKMEGLLSDFFYFLFHVIISRSSILILNLRWDFIM